MKTLTSTFTQGLSGFGSNDNEQAPYTPQTSKISLIVEFYLL